MEGSTIVSIVDYFDFRRFWILDFGLPDRWTSDLRLLILWMPNPEFSTFRQSKIQNLNAFPQSKIHQGEAHLLTRTLLHSWRQYFILRRMRTKPLSILALLLLSAIAVPAADNGSLPFVSPIFGDNMVLQRGKPNTIWGWSTPGQTVQV